MRAKALLLSLMTAFSLCSFAQADSVQRTPDFFPAEGIYLDYNDFRASRVIRKQQVVSRFSKDQLEFLSKVMYADTFLYQDNGRVIAAESARAWGYVQNGTLYVNYKGNFYRVPVFGAISYLVANVTVTNPGFYDPRFGVAMGPSTVTEVREFLMDFYDGRLVEFTPEALDQMLSKDASLYEQFKQLSRRRQKEQAYAYIRKFNAAHPVYFFKDAGE